MCVTNAILVAYLLVLVQLFHFIYNYFPYTLQQYSESLYYALDDIASASK